MIYGNVDIIIKIIGCFFTKVLVEPQKHKFSFVWRNGCNHGNQFVLLDILPLFTLQLILHYNCSIFKHLSVIVWSDYIKSLLFFKSKTQI
jgi:hypothetical protein